MILTWIKDMLDFYANPNTDSSPKLKTDYLSDVKIPFISQISLICRPKEKECVRLLNVIKQRFKRRHNKIGNTKK